MILKNTFTLFLVAFTCLVFFSSKNDPRNPPVARTGAPNETTCQTGGCHNGGSYTGTVSLRGLPDTVVAGRMYTISVLQKSNAKRAGFELTALGPDLKSAGKLGNLTGTSMASNLGRDYIRQANAKTFTDTVSWMFTWTAPTSLVGDSITFYYVGLAANNDGKESLDNALTGKNIVYFSRPTTSIDETQKLIQISQVNHNLVIRNASNTNLIISNIAGMKIQENKLTNDVESIRINNSKADIYFIQLINDQNRIVYSSKIYIP